MRQSTPTNTKIRTSDNPKLQLSKLIGLPLGVVLFIVVLLIPTPEGLSPEAHRVGALTILMSVWWLTEAVPIYVTALVPLAMLPILRVTNIAETAAPYANPIVFLFLGGFMLAIAMQRWDLHRRIALYIVRFIGTEPRMLLLGFMVATAIMSMWVSNTATTMMIFPIGLALATQFGNSSSGASPSNSPSFVTALMLGIAYAASIGGVATLIGTPPNAILAGQSEILFPEYAEITFVKWMMIGLPYLLIFLPLAWLYLSRFHIRKNEVLLDKDSIHNEYDSLPPISRGEMGVVIIFFLTVFGWLFRSNIELGFITIPGWANLLGLENWVSDATVALIAALLLFVVPTRIKKPEFLLNWEWAIKIPWGILILFGGGFALAQSFHSTELASWLGQNLVGLSQIPLPVFIILLCLFITLIGELASNTALAAVMIPVLGAAAISADVHPFLYVIPATMAASSGFMLPVATPPNAIVYGSGVLTIRQMIRAGIVMDLLGAVIIAVVTFVFVIPVFGL